MKVVQAIVMLGVISGVNFYVLYRIWCMIPPNLALKAVFLFLGIMVALSPFIAIFAGAFLPVSVVSLFYKAGTSWLIMLVYLFLFFLLFDLLRLTRLPVEPFLFRSWYGLLCVGLLIAGLMIGGNWKYRNKERVGLSLFVNKTGDSDVPLKIVAASDLHLGYSIGKGELEEWVKLINAENPDIVLIAGDIVDNSLKPLLKEDIAAVFLKIKAKYGIYAVPGNHEYISGIERSLAFFESAGIVSLRDSAVLVDNRFYLIGRDDRTNAGRKPLAGLTVSLDKSKPLVLLDHQPYRLDDAERNGIDLQISGHTHRGQVWPLSLLADLIYEKSHGYLNKGSSHIYVSSGLGIWGGKYRIGTQSEYVVIELSTR